jgi:hypothetical protein
MIYIYNFSIKGWTTIVSLPIFYISQNKYKLRYINGEQFSINI